jgi:hypothetical protein
MAYVPSLMPYGGRRHSPRTRGNLLRGRFRVPNLLQTINIVIGKIRFHHPSARVSAEGRTSATSASWISPSEPTLAACQDIFYMIVARLLFLAAFCTYPCVEAAAQIDRCELSGKTISYRYKICLSTGCSDNLQRITVVGDRVLQHLGPGSTSGRIYYIGRSIDATQDPAQNRNPDAALTSPIPGARYVVKLKSAYSNETLLLEDEETLYDKNPNIPGAIVKTRTKIDVKACKSCVIEYTFIARHDDGRRDDARAQGYWCEISQNR